MYIYIVLYTCISHTERERDREEGRKSLREREAEAEAEAEMASIESELQSAGVLQQMRLHLESESGKELLTKIGLVYQINIAPKVPQ